MTEGEILANSKHNMFGLKRKKESLTLIQQNIQNAGSPRVCNPHWFGGL